MLTSLLLLTLTSDLGAPRELPEQEQSLKVVRYFTEAASAGDHETVAWLTDAEGLRGRKGESPRSVVNAYVARLTRAGCVLDEKQKANEFKQNGKDVAGVRLLCNGGKHEDVTLTKVAGLWKVSVP
ncbi:MAG: hypothetical protein JNG84_07065 [Archangium sp.]|nr:hypothetical protein [Archangium sp.]